MLVASGTSMNASDRDVALKNFLLLKCKGIWYRSNNDDPVGQESAAFEDMMSTTSLQLLINHYCYVILINWLNKCRSEIL